ncbi:MAG TPA: ABC transporter permease [Chloroflexota bacterium]|nr:ABC transporter permease [Chloroflexota bacterium]
MSMRQSSGTDRFSSVRRRLEPALRVYGDVPLLGPLTGLVILIIFFTIRSPVFFTYGNFTNVLLQVMEVGTLAVGQTIIIIAAGIDLSNGAIMVFSSVVMAQLATGNAGQGGALGIPVPLAIAAGVGVAMGLGLVNGILVAFIRLPPFIVTLGMLNIAFSSTILYTHSSTVTNLPGQLLFLGNTFNLGSRVVPVGPLVMLGVVAIMWYALTQTAWGKHVYAIGNNIEAARLTGIDTTKLLISIYIIAGLIYAVAALLVIGRTTVGDPLAGQTDNLDSITAVVIGGTSLFGGRGSIIGTLIGALIVGIIRNGLTLIGVDAEWQTFATGALVIVAVAVDQATRRRRR